MLVRVWGLLTQRYCCKEHQAADWPNHRELCQLHMIDKNPCQECGLPIKRVDSIPCPECKTVFYCSEKCRKDAKEFHEESCASSLERERPGEFEEIKAEALAPLRLREPQSSTERNLMVLEDWDRAIRQAYEDYPDHKLIYWGSDPTCNFCNKIPTGRHLLDTSFGIRWALTCVPCWKERRDFAKWHGMLGCGFGQLYTFDETSSKWLLSAGIANTHR